MKYFFSTLLFLGLASFNYAQDLYDLNTIQTIEISFAEDNWDQLLDLEKAGDGNYIMAQSVTINGIVFDSVGVKYKGNSTYDASQVKNPFHIELDTYKDHIYESYTDIKLSNVAKDPSFLREVLSYQILGQYMDAPRSNYANVYINGTLIGLYSNSESISKKFVDDRFGSKDNTFIKCNPPDGAGPQSSDLPNLVYLGQDSTNYFDAYELKSDAGWQDLIDLCELLETDVENIETMLDVDRVLWMLAYNNALVNLDSYIGQFAQNYYLYRDDYGRFIPVIWDLNESFGRFSATGSGNLQNTTAKQQMDYLLHDSDADFPLMQQLMSVPMYKKMYLAHYKTILLENFSNSAYFTTGQALQILIDEAVQADNNKFFSYANFIDNLESDINGGGGPGGGSTPGISNLMDGRVDYLFGLSAFSQTAPEISDITLSTATPIIDETLTIRATIASTNAVYLGYRTEARAPFTRLAMYDDGMHDDGAANDGVFGIQMEIENAFTQYYIYAENEVAGMFSPQRAEYEYHTITATISEPDIGDLVINELLASNDAIQADASGEFDDWIELYNNGSTDIDLEGYFLSDDPENLMKWPFPEGASIAANAYLIIWADEDENQSGLHANFKLAATAESLFLVDASGTIVDEVSFADQTADISYGRYPNGTGSFQTMTPTFNAENNLSTNTLEPLVNLIEFSVYPNPAQEVFYLDFKDTFLDEQLVLIYDLNGKEIYRNKLIQDVAIDVSDWSSGLYVLKVGEAYTRLIVQ